MAILAAYAVPHPPLIIPSVGRGQEEGIPATVASYQEVARRVARLAPDTIIVSSPHAPAYLDGFAVCPGPKLVGDMRRFRSNEKIVARIDTRLAKALQAAARDAGVPLHASAWRGANMDHATFIPLYFVNRLYSNYQLLVVGLSGLSAHEHRVLGQLIAEEAKRLGRRAVFLASGDLSHKLKADGPYGFVPEGPRFDALITEAWAQDRLEDIFDFDSRMCDAAAECGLRSFQIMAGALDAGNYKGELLSYEGPFGVGYGVAAFEPRAAAEAEAPAAAATTQPEATEDGSEPGLDRDPDPYVALAIESFTAFTLRGEHIALPANLPEEMLSTRAGAFVSLHAQGELRGCIGTLGPVRENVAEEIVCNAIAACSEDPRFAPLRPEELPDIECSVDVLGEPEDISGIDELDVKRYGVIVSKGWKRGVLLPDLEGVDTPEMQLIIAKQKAGIPINVPCEIQRFEVVRHHLYPEGD